MMCNAFLGEYLNMLSINDMLNPESSSDNNPGGNHSGSDGNHSGPSGNNSGGNGPDSGKSVPEADSEDVRSSVESKFRIQHDYNKNVSISIRPDVYSHEGAGRLNQGEIDYLHRNVHLNPAWHYSMARGKILRRIGVKAATGVIKVTTTDIRYMSRFPNK